MEQRTLAALMPQIAASLGVAQVQSQWLEPSESVVLWLIDGMGWRNLEDAPVSHPVLEQLRAQSAGTTSFPSTTPVALTTLGTGMPAGAHGVVGATFELPDFETLLRPLHWAKHPDPIAVQPEPTWFEKIAASGLNVTRLGPAAYSESGLTVSALRGGEHQPAENLEELVAGTLHSAATPGLVYGYHPDLDKIGHVHSAASDDWNQQLLMVLDALAKLRAGLPANTRLLVTADHGMLDVQSRVWIEDRPGLLRNMRLLAGEPRLRHVYAEPGKAEVLRRDWEAITDIADVYTREEFIALGWMGEVEEFAAERVGDVVAVARDAHAIASRKFDPRASALKGLHGSTSEVECLIPIAELAV